jgi:hypothetical protein
MNSNYAERNPNLLSFRDFAFSTDYRRVRAEISHSRSFSAAERLWAAAMTAGHHGSADLARHVDFF